MPAHALESDSVPVVRASGGDDLTAINANLATGSVYLPDPLYLVSGEVVVPNLHDLNGAGMEATVIRATAAGAKVTFNDRGGDSGNFSIDGDAVATNALVIQGTERHLHSIKTFDTLGDQILVGTLTKTAQNMKLYGVNGHNAGGSVWVFDGGCGNIDLYGCYGEHSGGWIIKSQRSGASPTFGATQPTAIRFFGGIFERPEKVDPLSIADGLGAVSVTAGADIMFHSSNFSLDGTPTADLPIIQANLSDAGANTARVQLIGPCQLDGNAGASTGLKVANGGQIHISGRPLLRNCLYGLDFDDNSTIYPDRIAVSGITNTFRQRGTRTQDGQVRDLVSYPREVRRPASSDTVFAWRADGDSTGWRGVLTIGDGLFLGPASTFTHTNYPSFNVVNGSPEGVVTAAKGSMRLRLDGGVGTILYIKESGTGNTGWVAYGASGAEPVANAHISDTTAAHAASAIGFTPAGDLASTDAQAAIVELDAEKQPKVEAINTVATAGSAQTIPDPATSSVNDFTLTAATCTLTFPTATSGKSFLLLVRQDASGSRAIAWPAAVQWAGGADPTLTGAANAKDIFSFTCIGGVWYGFIAGQVFS
jgi:hypothetical protein